MEKFKLYLLGYAALSLLIIFLKFDGGSKTEANGSEGDKDPREITYSDSVNNMGPYSDEEICRAAISSLLNQELEETKARVLRDDIYRLSYVRKSDNALWETQCRIEGNQVNWGTLGSRWRNHELDTAIHFKVSDDKLTIQEHYPGDGNFYAEYEKIGGVISAIK